MTSAISTLLYHDHLHDFTVLQNISVLYFFNVCLEITLFRTISLSTPLVSSARWRTLGRVLRQKQLTRRKTEGTKERIRYRRDSRRNVKTLYWCETRGSITLLLYLSFSPSLPRSISLYLSIFLPLSISLSIYLSLYISLTLLYPSLFIILTQ